MAGSFNGRTRAFEARCGCSIHSPVAKVPIVTYPDSSGEDVALIRLRGAVGTRIRDHFMLQMLDGNERADCESVRQVFESLLQYQFHGGLV